MKLGVLARKPDAYKDNAAFNKPRDPRPIPYRWRESFAEVKLGPDDSEAKWVRQALERVLVASDIAHDSW